VIRRRRRARQPRRAIAVAVVDRSRSKTDAAFVRRVVRAAAAFGRRPDLRVSVLLTGDAEIGRLHGQFLGDPSATDVMSFPDGDAADVVVNVVRARREAKRRGVDERSELALYLAHGVLHACGFRDDDASARSRMRAAEHAVLTSLGLCAAPVE
jgi:probable rRNA maturation factor